MKNYKSFSATVLLVIMMFFAISSSYASDEATTQIEALNSIDSGAIGREEIGSFVDLLFSGVDIASIEDANQENVDSIPRSSLSLEDTAEFVDKLDDSQLDILLQEMAEYTGVAYDEIITEKNSVLETSYPTSVRNVHLASQTSNSEIFQYIIVVIFLGFVVTLLIFKKNYRLMFVILSASMIITMYATDLWADSSSWDEGEIENKWYASQPHDHIHVSNRWSDGNCDGDPNDNDYVFHFVSTNSHELTVQDEGDKLRWTSESPIIYTVFQTVYDGTLSGFGSNVNEVRLCLGNGALRVIGVGSAWAGSVLVQEGIYLSQP